MSRFEKSEFPKQISWANAPVTGAQHTKNGAVDSFVRRVQTSYWVINRCLSSYRLIVSNSAFENGGVEIGIRGIESGTDT